MTNMMRGHVSCWMGCCRSKPGDVESARAIDKRAWLAEVETALAWEVDVHDHWDDTPVILKAADEHGI